MRFVDLEKVMSKVAYKTLLSTDELQKIVGSARSPLERLAGAIGKKLVRSTDMFSIAIKPFMDRYSYDQDRVANCCHHMTDTEGRLVSFCEYNARLRPNDSWQRFPNQGT
jgi:tetraether lipid synthase